jgi:hypothetical protein
VNRGRGWEWALFSPASTTTRMGGLGFFPPSARTCLTRAAVLCVCVCALLVTKHAGSQSHLYALEISSLTKIRRLTIFSPPLLCPQQASSVIPRRRRPTPPSTRRTSRARCGRRSSTKRPSCRGNKRGRNYKQTGHRATRRPAAAAAAVPFAASPSSSSSTKAASDSFQCIINLLANATPSTASRDASARQPL